MARVDPLLKLKYFYLFWCNLYCLLLFIAPLPSPISDVLYDRHRNEPVFLLLWAGTSR